MLRSEHAIIHYDFRKLITAPDRLRRRQDVAYLEVAERMVQVYRQGVGQCRQELHRAIAELTSQLIDCPPKRTAAFCKLLDDWADYRTHAKAANLRKRVFQTAAAWHPIVQQRQGIFEHDLQAARDQLQSELKLTWQQIESSLFADVIELQVLQAFPDQISGEALLAAYNLAQTQAALYRSVEARLRISEHAKAIIRQIKLAGLMHRIERIDGSPPRYTVRLDGPQSNLRETTRYGVRLACIIPTLIRYRGWQLDARVLGPNKQAFRLTLSDADGLRSLEPNEETFDSLLEQEIDAAWRRHPVDNWTWEHESELLCIGQSVLTPDFALRHRQDGTVIHVEVVGFWTPEYLADKRSRLQRFLAHPDHAERHWLLILAEKLKPSARETIAGLNLPVLVWKKSIPPSTWIETALAGQNRSEVDR